MAIRVGIGLGATSFEDPRTFFRLAERCEGGGVDSLWQSDRLVGEAPSLEPMACMATLAGCTQRIKFGMNAVVVSLRNPLVLAKQCATIDHLSGGRLLPVFGVGVAGAKEWQAMGRDPAGRGRRANEALAIMSQLWRGDSVDFEGEFYRYHQARIAPLPHQQPLPLWIGGGSKAAIQRTARLGTGWLGGLMGSEAVGPVVQAIRSESRAAGRPIPEDHYGATLPFRLGNAEHPAVQRFMKLPRSLVGVPDPSSALAVGDVPAVIERIASYVAAGVSKFVCLPLAEGESDIADQIERLVAEVLPVVEAPAFEAGIEVEGRPAG